MVIGSTATAYNRLVITTALQLKRYVLQSIKWILFNFAGYINQINRTLNLGVWNCYRRNNVLIVEEPARKHYLFLFTVRYLAIIDLNRLYFIAYIMQVSFQYFKFLTICFKHYNTVIFVYHKSGCWLIIRNCHTFMIYLVQYINYCIYEYRIYAYRSRFYLLPSGYFVRSVFRWR